MIPSGSELLVRLVERIDTSAETQGKRWAAVVSRDLRTPEGDLLIGAGSPLYFGVVQGQGGFALVIRSVMVNGNSYISSVPVTASAAPLAGLDPWGPATRAADIQLSGDKISVPGQTLVAVKLTENLPLR